MWSELSLCVANVCELIKIAKQEVKKHVLVKKVAKVMWRESKSNKVPAA